MMRLRLFMLVATALFGAAAAHGETPAPGRTETVTFQSGSYADFRQVFMGQPATSAATVAATLSFPAEARDRYPALVIVHTIVGYQEANEGWHAAEFRRAGFATLTYDSFAARELSEAAVTGSSAGPPFASAVADAYAALRLLAHDPRIDPDRIGIVGFSFGGEVAHLTAFERLRAMYLSGPLRFAAHVAYYPAGVYGSAVGQGAYTGAPILMLLGEQDDNLPVAKMTGYLAYAKDAGSPPPIELSLYPGAYHAWTVPGVGPMRFHPEYGSTRKCPLILLGQWGPSLLTDGQTKPMEADSLQACLQEGRGYAMAFDPAIRHQSTADALAFLQRHLRP